MSGVAARALNGRGEGACIRVAWLIEGIEARVLQPSAPAGRGRGGLPSQPILRFTAGLKPSATAGSVWLCYGRCYGKPLRLLLVVLPGLKCRLSGSNGLTS